jgi:4-hydroxy-tetrahydrodipicolinate synthase
MSVTTSMKMNWRQHPWAGVFPATLCAFHQDESLDEEGLASYYADLAGVEGVKGLVCNGHTGEIMSLRPRERARVTRILASVARKSKQPIKTVSGVSAEGSLEAIEHALEAKESGADAILLMPPHHWIRFGRSSRTAVGFIGDVAAGANIPVVIHQYPAWTKAGYTLAEMLEMVKLPQVVMIKMGTRDMSRCRHDYEQLKAAAPHVPIVTCHDEFLLPSLLEGADGALIGFAGLVPELMIELVHAALDGDLPRARKAQEVVAPLARLIYHSGEPGCEAHQRMKACRWLLGKFPTLHFRRPVRPLPPEEIDRLGRELESLGFQCPQGNLDSQIAPRIDGRPTKSRARAAERALAK